MQTISTYPTAAHTRTSTFPPAAPQVRRPVPTMAFVYQTARAMLGVSIAEFVALAGGGITVGSLERFESGRPWTDRALRAVERGLARAVASSNRADLQGGTGAFWDAVFAAAVAA